MSDIRELKAILGRAEKEILAAIAAAAKTADLSGIDEARWVIGELRQIAAGLSAGRLVEASNSRVQSGTKRKKDESKGAKKVRATDYPRFDARNGTLYRTAWSRKKGEEYEHKVPKGIVDLISRTLESISASDPRPVLVENLIAKVNRSSPVQIPQYQVYLVVSWLRHMRCIEQVGRDGYLVRKHVIESVENQWKLLSRNHQ